MNPESSSFQSLLRSQILAWLYHYSYLQLLYDEVAVKRKWNGLKPGWWPKKGTILSSRDDSLKLFKAALETGLNNKKKYLEVWNTSRLSARVGNTRERKGARHNQRQRQFVEPFPRESKAHNPGLRMVRQNAAERRWAKGEAGASWCTGPRAMVTSVGARPKWH